jgi:hypothetical protein
MPNFVMQAVASVGLTLVTWNFSGSAPDFSGSAYPGPGSPLYIARVAQTPSSGGGSGGGTPAGTTGDVQICGAGSTFDCDTGQFVYDKTLPSFKAGSGNTANAPYTSAIGLNCQATNTYAQASGVSSVASGLAAQAHGDGCTASATGAFACGISATAARCGEFAHCTSPTGGGLGFAATDYGVIAASGFGPQLLTNDDSSDVVLPDGFAYSITVKATATQAGGAGVAWQKHEIVCHVVGGILVKDDEIITAPPTASMAAAGYAFTCDAFGVNNQLQLNFDPGGVDAKCCARVHIEVQQPF